MATALLTIQPLQTGVRFASETAVVEVDCSRHTLRLAVCGGRNVEYASSRRGLEGMTTLVLIATRRMQGKATARPGQLPQAELFAVGEEQHVATNSFVDAARVRALVRQSLLDALRRGAERSWQGPVPLADVVSRVDKVAPTPLVFSRHVVESRWFACDAVAFRPAAIALALLEDRAAGWQRVDVVAQKTGDLSRWQMLYAPHGTVTRALTKTLADHGERAAAGDLWALRRVALSRPVKSPVHLEVLAELSRVAPGQGPNPEVVRLIEDASQEELVGHLERVAALLRQPHATRAEQVHLFSELLVERRDPVGALRLGGVVRAQLAGGHLPGAQRHGRPRPERMDARRPTVRPPIPLPNVEGVTFLSTVGEVYDEGERMRHCVGTHAARALSGGSYLFHVEHEGDAATVELDARGMVLQVAGPANARMTPACKHAHLTLGRWALPLRVAVLGAWTQSVWHAPAPAVAECRALLTLADVVEAAQRWCSRTDVDALGLVSWLVAQTRAALAGDAWLVETGDDVLVLGADGAVRGRAMTAHVRVREGKWPR